MTGWLVLSLVANVVLVAWMLGSARSRQFAKAITELSHELDISSAVHEERKRLRDFYFGLEGVNPNKVAMQRVVLYYQPLFDDPAYVDELWDAALSITDDMHVHDWVDATNEVVDGEYCKECGAMR